MNKGLAEQCPDGRWNKQMNAGTNMCMHIKGGNTSDLCKVGIITDDEGILAPKLQHNRSEILGSSLHDLLADLGGPHKDELVDA